MSGIDKDLVKHRLPIKEGYEPVKWLPRRMFTEIELQVKEEIDRLLKTGFNRLAQYMEWLANIVPVLKKVTKAVKICVGYKSLNKATPKDEYLMPMADMLIDAVAHNQNLSCIVAEKDNEKTTFRCPGAGSIWICCHVNQA